MSSDLPQIFKFIMNVYVDENEYSCRRGGLCPPPCRQRGAHAAAHARGDERYHNDADDIRRPLRLKRHRQRSAHRRAHHHDDGMDEINVGADARDERRELTRKKL